MQFSAMNRLRVLAVLFQTALLASALPVDTRDETKPTPKTMALWDWKLTAEAPNNPNLQATAQAIESSPKTSVLSNWNSWTPTDVKFSDKLSFAPMVRTLNQLQGEDYKNLIASLESGVPTSLLQFLNEPDMNGISPADAANAWRTSILPLKAKYNVPTCGPATASNEAGTLWMDQFYNALQPNEKPDLLCAHFYSNKDGTAQSQTDYGKNYFTTLHTKFGLDIVVSEVASTSTDPANVQTFTKDMRDWFEQTNFIKYYAFMGLTLNPVDGFVSPAAQLMDTTGSLTPLGHDVMGA